MSDEQVKDVSNETNDIVEVENKEVAVTAEPTTTPDSSTPIIDDTLRPPKMEFKKQYVTQEFNISRADGDDSIVIDLPTYSEDDVYRYLREQPRVEILNSKLGEKWFKTVEQARLFNVNMKAFNATLENDKANFRQRIEHNGQPLMNGTPSMPIGDNKTLTGEKAIMHLNDFIGKGTRYQVALWHSGFWITFKAPTESEFVELQRKLIADKVKFGRDSYGLVFSNTVVFSVERVVEFILDHVLITSINLGENNNSNYLRSIIDSQDLYTLIYGFVCTMYPKGFKYNRACMNDIMNCNYVLEDILNVTKLSHTNDNALTNWQKSHMSNRRAGSMTIESVKRYKEELLSTQKRTVVINKDTGKEIKLTLRTPNLNEYIDSGHEWINNIVAMAERSIGDDVPAQQREDFIIKTAQATAMRQYGHWVGSCEFNFGVDDESPNIIEDKDTLKLTLDTLSSQDNIREEFFKEVYKYIDESTVTVIGITAFDCPVCNKKNEDERKIYPHHTNVIPLDMLQLFFALLEQSIQRLTNR